MGQQWQTVCSTYGSIQGSQRSEESRGPQPAHAHAVLALPDGAQHRHPLRHEPGLDPLAPHSPQNAGATTASHTNYREIFRPRL